MEIQNESKPRRYRFKSLLGDSVIIAMLLLFSIWVDLGFQVAIFK